MPARAVNNCRSAPGKKPRRRRLLIGAAIECAVSAFAVLRFLFLLLMAGQPD
jgi:hypothetical protein